MLLRHRGYSLFAVLCLMFFGFCLPVCFGQIPLPEKTLGFKPGADFRLATYEQAISYLELLAGQSKRVQIFDMGQTGYGRRMKYAVISSEENMAKLDRYKEINRKLSLGRGISKEDAERMAEEGKIFVWIDGGLHKEEVVGSQMISQLAYDMISGDDRQTRSIRDHVILILVYINPDGMTQVAEWYMKNVGTKYEDSPLPWLYLKLGGTNRDGFVSNLIETKNINKALNEWFPEIYHNQHQTGPYPARIFIPPEGEPTNSNVHPLVIREKSLIGAAMGHGLDQANLPGSISRASYDTWFPGYATQIAELHNIPGILTETQSTGTTINRLGLATPRYYTINDFPEEYRDLDIIGIFYPTPWKAGWWRLADQVEYNITASKAELDIASKYRFEFLLNKWKMSTDIIERFKREPPYGWIISANQRDLNAAAQLINKLLVQNLEVYTADKAFEHAGYSYPRGSYIIPTSQPFGLFVKNLLEIQNHPDLRKYSHVWQALPRLVKYDAAPMSPYDQVGWTLPIQMGVDSQAITRPLETSMTLVKEASFPAGGLAGSGPHYIFNHTDNNSFLALNRILEAGGKVSWSLEEFTFERTKYPKGTFIVDSGSISGDKLRNIATSSHLPLKGANVLVAKKPLSKPRIALYKPWVENDNAAWNIWLLEEYGFPFRLLPDSEVKAGNLASRFDVILLSDQAARSIINGYAEGTTPPEYVGGITAEGVNNLRRFVEEGGTIICNKSSSDLAIEGFRLPVKNVLHGVKEDGFNCPGSLLRIDYDMSHPIAYGMEEKGVGLFSGSAMRDTFLGGYAFELLPESKDPQKKQEKAAPKIVARYPNESLLISGWLIGGDKIQGKAAILDVPLGKGRVILFGLDVQNRAQSHSTFKLLFNALYYR